MHLYETEGGVLPAHRNITMKKIDPQKRKESPLDEDRQPKKKQKKIQNLTITNPNTKVLMHLGAGKRLMKPPSFPVADPPQVKIIIPVQGASTSTDLGVPLSSRTRSRSQNSSNNSDIPTLSRQYFSNSINSPSFDLDKLPLPELQRFHSFGPVITKKGNPEEYGVAPAHPSYHFAGTEIMASDVFAEGSGFTPKGVL